MTELTRQFAAERAEVERQRAAERAELTRQLADARAEIERLKRGPERRPGAEALRARGAR